MSGAPLRRAYGLDRGFASYDDTGLAAEGGNAFTPMSRPAKDATDRALSWIRGRGADSPLFLWVHYYDAHSPYAPPSPYRETYAAHPYAGEIAYVDAQLGRLLDALRADRGREWTVAGAISHREIR